MIISIEEAEEIIAFTKMHEREEIPDEMWDIAMRLQEELLPDCSLMCELVEGEIE